MGLTVKLADIEKVVKGCVYYPHSRVRVGRVFLHPSGDDSLVFFGRCRIDLTGDVYIGQYVMIAGGVELHTHYHDLTGRQPLLLKEAEDEVSFTKPIDKAIGDDVWIFRSTILAKCERIAKGVVIGVGSIVTRSIDEEYSIWAGNPARKVGMR